MISWEVCVTSTLYIFDLRFLQVFDPIRFAILEMALRRAFFTFSVSFRPTARPHLSHLSPRK